MNTEREFTMSQYANKDDLIAALQKRIEELEAVLAKKDDITELLEVTDMPLSDINPDCLPKVILEKSGMPILNENEISLLARFKETSEDDSSYDLSVDELQILAQYGALKHNGGGYYSITEIGEWLLNLPIKAGDVQAPKEVKPAVGTFCTVNNADKSTCQLHNLHCAYPACCTAATTDTEGK